MAEAGGQGRPNDPVGMANIDDACTAWAQEKYGSKYKVVLVDKSDLNVIEPTIKYRDVKDGIKENPPVRRSDRRVNRLDNPLDQEFSSQSTTKYSCAWTQTKGGQISGDLSVKVGLPAAVGLSAKVGGQVQLSSTKTEASGTDETSAQKTTFRQNPRSIVLTETVTTQKTVTMDYALNFRLEGTVKITLQKNKKKQRIESVDVANLYPEGKTVTDSGGRGASCSLMKGSLKPLRKWTKKNMVSDPDRLMKITHNALLRDNSEKIVEEVKDEPAMSRLLEVMSSEQVISEEQLKTLSDQKLSVKESVDKLILVLENAEPERFLSFVDILRREGYNELVELLEPIYPDNIRQISNLTGLVDHYFVTKKESEVKNSLESARGAILHGMPGSGKTQLAIKVASDYARMHPHAVVWVLDGSSEEKLKDGIEKLQQRLHGEANVVDISMFQSNISRWQHCLLTINDLSPTVAIPPQLMTSSAKLIITTQDSLLCHEDVRSIPVEGYTEDEAVEFLSPQMPAETSREEMRELANIFSCLPLGLAAAQASIYRGNMTVEEYKRQLRGGRAAMEALMKRENIWLRTHYKPEHQEAGRNIFAALQLAIDSLDDQCSPGEEKKCKVMLQQCAFLEPNKIPVLILKAALTSSPTIGSEAHFTERMKMYSLGSIVGEGVKRRLSIHGVTQMALRLQLDKEQQTTTCINRLLQILVKFFSKDTMYTEMYKFSLLLMPHVEVVLKHVDKLGAGPEYRLMKAQLLLVYGHLLIEKGAPALSEEYLNKAQEQLMELAGIAGHSLCAKPKGPKTIFSTDDNLQELFKSLVEKSQSLDDNFFQETVVRRVITEEHLRAIRDKLGADDTITVALENMVGNFEPLTTEMYNALVDRDLAIPIEKLKKTFLPELYGYIIYTLGKTNSRHRPGIGSGGIRLFDYSAGALYIFEKVSKETGVMVFAYFLVASDMVIKTTLALEAEQFTLVKQVKAEERMVVRLTALQCYDFGVLTSIGKITVMNYYQSVIRYCIIVFIHASQFTCKLIPLGQDMYAKLLELVESESKAKNTPTGLAEYHIIAGQFKSVLGELEEAAEMFWEAYRVELKRDMVREGYHPRMNAALSNLYAVRIIQKELRKARVCARRRLQLAQDHWPQNVADAEERLKYVCCKIVFRALKRNKEEETSNCMKVTTV